MHCYLNSIQCRLAISQTIYIIIAKNIDYLCWKWGAWHSLQSMRHTIEGLGIQLTNHLCDACCLNWTKSTFHPSLNLSLSLCSWFENVISCWPIVMSSIREPAASYCDITMADCSQLVSIGTYLSQWHRDQGLKETVMLSFSSLFYRKNLWSHGLFHKLGHN